MKCIKCGTEIAADQIFCPDCLEDMERHPVKPDTPLILPKRDAQPAVKRTHRKKTVKPEERISGLRKTVITLLILIILLIVSQTVTIMMLLNLKNGNETPFLPGQNYGTSATVTENTGR